uniref:Uncharacterized protein n=1 Tax=Bos indicus x Bos taurus TaxID=30522 RepID=A0A4W2DNI8_BOBOX
MMPQKDKKPEKSAWRFNLDQAHPIEDGFLILEILNIFLLEKTYELYYFKISQDEGGFESED